MQKNLWKKGLAYGLILLIIGAIIIPSISGEYRNINVLSDEKIVTGKSIEIKKSDENPINNRNSSLVSYWKFDEGSGNTVYDSESGNDGTIYSAVWTSGISGSALSFNGADNCYVNCGSDSSLNLVDGITISVWVKLDVLKNIQDIVFRSTSSPYKGYALEVRPDRVLFLIQGSSAAKVKNYNIPIDTWTHIAVSRPSGGKYSIYINGVDETTWSFDYSPASVNTRFIIGGSAGTGGWKGRGFDGVIDEVRIYDISLTSNQIQDLYLEFTNKPPVANFTHNPSNPINMDVIEFTDVSTDCDGDVVSWYWDFGDGYYSDLKNPIHCYYNSGTFDLIMTVYDNNGSADHKSFSIDVRSPLEAIEDLIDIVIDMNLSSGLEGTLLAKLNHAIDFLNDNQTESAINQLLEFINKVEAQRGKKLTDEQADILVGEAEHIIDNLNY
jgi:PKD repeat protein